MCLSHFSTVCNKSALYHLHVICHVKPSTGSCMYCGITFVYLLQTPAIILVKPDIFDACILASCNSTRFASTCPSKVMAQSSKYKISDTGGFGNDDNALSAKQLLRNLLASAQRSLPLAGSLYFIPEQIVPASRGLIDSSAFATKSSSTNV